VVEADPNMKDFYDDYDAYAPVKSDEERYNLYLKSLSPQEKSRLASGIYYYQLDFSNLGGLVMPLVLQFEFSDGETTMDRVPAEIWSRNNLNTSKVYKFEKQVVSVTLDPFLETADCDTGNNHWPPRIEENRFDLFKSSYSRSRTGSNPMQQQ
jgi:hypothetical protein